jgi:eukaryotic-like serine/threonine-protein kinase
MASVWVARQFGKHGFEKLVAIKTILPRFAADVRFQKMFLDEARIAARLEHVNVAHILDLGEENEILYLAMEYVDGDALIKLARACQRGGIPFPAGVVLRVLADTCTGLHEAHELKDATGKPLEIVHRDVSPHNVLVSSRGIAKLIDFGIAKARSRVATATNSGVLKGKVQYMAPEQALGRPVDRRADVWAVGAVLYHLLAGRPPYAAENQLQTLHLLGSGRPPLPLPPGVHPAIGRIVRKALAHSRENRYPTAAELRAAIEDAMVQAKMPTTAADVAAFTTEHLGELAERRRRGIDRALAAAAERHRVEDLLRPTRERVPVTAPALPGGPHPILPLPSADAVNGRGAIVLGDVGRSPSRPPDDAEARTASLATRDARSYATFGSAALDASPPVPERPRSRKGMAAAVALVTMVMVTGASGLSRTMLRPRARVLAAPTPPTVAQVAAPAPTALLVAPPDPTPTTEPAPVSPAPFASGIPARRGNPSPTSASGALPWVRHARSTLLAASASPGITTRIPAPPVDDGF